MALCQQSPMHRPQARPDQLEYTGRMQALFAVAVVTILLPLTSLGQATQPVWQAIPHGSLMLRPFRYAPYPHPSREQGFKGRTATYPADPHYIDATVGLVIPAGYVPGETVDYIVHFHGHNNHVSKVIAQYKLAEQLAGSKVNAILIVPQGPRDAADSGGGKLELEPGGLEKLVNEVTQYLRAEGKIHATRIGRIALTSHSGGYKVTAAVLDHGGLADRITDVLLLDSSYGSLEWFAHWAAASPDHRLVSLFTPHLAKANEELIGLLDKAEVKHQTLTEAALTDAELARRGPTFMATAVPHDQVPVEYFGRLVGTCEWKAK
jgi:hypothetical protein